MHTINPPDPALTSEQIQYLELILSKRQRLWSGSSTMLLLLLGYIYCDEVYDWWLMVQHPEGYETAYASEIQISFITTVVIVLFFIAVFTIFYRRSIATLKRDIRDGCGKVVYKKIIRKSIVRETGRHYFFFADRKMPNKEVTSAEYYHYDPGTDFPVLVSAHAGIQIDGFYNYELF